MSSVFEPLHKLFNHPGLRKFLLALRIPIVLVFVALWPWWLQPELLVAGILVSLAGELLQVWCFACIEKEKVLTIRGPYQLCRNPMYLARYLLILGFVIVTGSWIACVLYTVVYWFYMVNRVKREEPVLEKIVAKIPVGRLGAAEEIARGVAFLTSDNGAFMTGSTMSINGGQHMY